MISAWVASCFVFSAPEHALGGTAAIAANPSAPSRGDIFQTAPRATVSWLKLCHDNEGYKVRWQTGYEIGVLSFEVQREIGGTWMRLRNGPVIADNHLGGGTYEVADTLPDMPAIPKYRLIAFDRNDQAAIVGEFQVEPESCSLTSLAAVPTEVKALARLASQPSSPAKASVPVDGLTGTYFVKLTTTNRGIVKVSGSSLATALDQPLADVQAAIANGAFRLANRGQSVSWFPAPNGSDLLFFAESYKDNYTDKNVYFLTSQPNIPPESFDGQSPAANTNATWFTSGGSFEQDLQAVTDLPQGPEEDYWMWKRLIALAGFDSYTTSFTIDQVERTNGGLASLTVNLWGAVNNASNRVQVTLNGQVIGQGDWIGFTPAQFTFSFGASNLVEGANTLLFKALIWGGTSPRSQWYLDRLTLNYPRRYAARSGALECVANTNSVLTIPGFTDSSITVIEVSNPKRPKLVSNVTIGPVGSGYRASFMTPNPSSSRYLVFQDGAAAAPASLSLASLADLSNPSHAAEYVAVAPQTLLSAATNLITWRSARGLTALIAPLEAVYDEFGYGFPTPHAIRHFLAVASTNWLTGPRYLVLLGDGTYDFRNIQLKNDNLTPTLMVSTYYGIFGSDASYGDINNDGLPEVAIGRLPGNSLAEVNGLVDKIKSYESQPRPLKPIALLIADQPDPAGDFDAEIAEIGSTVSPKFEVHSALRSASASDPDLCALVTNTWNAGVDFVNYAGHGAIDRFGSAGYLTSPGATNLLNSARLPVVVAVTCVAGQYSVPGTDCLGEYLLQCKAGGAIAVIAPTGLSWDAEARLLNQRLAARLESNMEGRLGDFIREALASHIREDKPYMPPWIYNLLGDPALAYNIPIDVLLSSPAPVNDGQHIIISWKGGIPPYQVEVTQDLFPGCSWDSAGPVTSNKFFIMDKSLLKAFFRVRSSN